MTNLNLMHQNRKNQKQKRTSDLLIDLGVGLEEDNISIKIEKIIDIYDKIVQKNYKEKKRNKNDLNGPNFSQFNNNFQNNYNNNNNILNNQNNINNKAFSLNNMNMNNNNMLMNNFPPSNQNMNNFQQGNNFNSLYNFNNPNYFPNNMINNFNLNNKNLNMMQNVQNINNNNNADIKNNKKEEIFITFTFKKMVSKYILMLIRMKNLVMH